MEDYIKSVLCFPAKMKEVAKGNILDWSHDSVTNQWMIKTDKKLTIGLGENVIYSLKFKTEKKV